MGVYIKGMEMPKNCVVCPFFVRSDSPKYPFVDCKLIGRLGSVFHAVSGIPVDCPLGPIPPHGRLIDADAFIGTIRPLCEEDKFAACTFETVKRLMVEHINNAPTIIPEEEGET